MASTLHNSSLDDISVLVGRVGSSQGTEGKWGEVAGASEALPRSPPHRLRSFQRP